MCFCAIYFVVSTSIIIILFYYYYLYIFKYISIYKLAH